MTNLSDVKQVKILQTSLRQVFISADGKEVMKFLEEVCGWYDFQEEIPDRILISHGKRQVLATIKTLLELPAETVAYISKQREV